MTAPADWLDVNKERPPLPRREKTPIFEEEFADRFDSATLELPVVRVWPVEAPAETDVHAVSPRVGDEPAAEFRAVKPSRFSREWWRGVLSLPRLVAGGASAAALLYGGIGAWFQ